MGFLLTRAPPNDSDQIPYLFQTLLHTQILNLSFAVKSNILLSRVVKCNFLILLIFKCLHYIVIHMSHLYQNTFTLCSSITLILLHSLLNLVQLVRVGPTPRIYIK